MQAPKITKSRWTEEEKERLERYAHLSPREALPYFPGRTYKSVKSMLYQHARANSPVKYYTPRAFYSSLGELSKNDRFRVEYRQLPKGDLETSDLALVEVPSVIDFDIYALRFGFPLNDEVLKNKAA
jgi:hypothetical protein